MKKFLTFLSLFILIGCSNELKKCVDANTNANTWYEDNKIDRFIDVYVKDSICMYDFTYSSQCDSFMTEVDEFMGNSFGMSTLANDEVWVIDCFLDALDKFDFKMSDMDDNTNWKSAESKLIDELKKSAKKCNDKRNVTADRAEKICNKQGIY